MLNLSIKHQSPLKKKIGQLEKGVEHRLPFNKQKSQAEKILTIIQQVGLYLAIFLAGYMVATIQAMMG